MTLTLGPGLRLPRSMVTEPIGVLANRGRGKSFTTHVLVEEMHAAGDPVVVLDIKGDWWGLRSSADGRHGGLPFIIFGGDHADVPLEPTAGELLADLVVDERVSVVLDLSIMSKTKARSFTTAFAERLYRRNREPLFIVVDEADVLIPQRSTAETARLLGAMEDIAKRGRGRGIGIAVVTQRPQEVAKSVLDLMDTLVLLGMTGPRSLKSVKEWISAHVDEDTTAQEVMASLPSLPVGHAWVWSPMQQLLKQVAVRPLQTFDSHVTPKPGETRREPRGRADIDLEALGARIAATVERARADDPKELRARVTQLERELAAERARPTPEPVTVEVPALPADLLDRFTETSRAVLDAVAAIESHLQHLTATERPQAASAPASRRLTPGRTPAAQGAPASAVAPVKQRAGAAAQMGLPPGEDLLHLKAGARRILETLARHHPLRLTRAQLGTLAKFKITGGTFGTYWSTLKRHGLVEETSTDVAITQAGLDYVGGQVSAPLTPEETLEQWRSVLKAGARAMLDHLVSRYPDTVAREDLAAHVAMAPTGGTFGTYLSTLRRNGLIDVDGSQLRASSSLISEQGGR